MVKKKEGERNHWSNSMFLKTTLPTYPRKCLVRKCQGQVESEGALIHSNKKKFKKNIAAEPWEQSLQSFKKKSDHSKYS